MKLLLGLGMTLITTALFTVIVGLSSLASPVLSYVLLPVWAVLSAYLCRKLYLSVGYRIDAGHIAITTGAISEGYIPPNAVPLSSDMVTQRFHGQKHYSMVKKLIAQAVRELNTEFTNATSLMGEVPGMKLMVEVGRLFLRLHLSYMNSACLAYTFFRVDEGLYLSAAEGCAIFSINWKQLTKSASDVAILETLVISVLTAVLSIGINALMGLMNIGQFWYFAVILALMLVLTLKHAYLDSFFSIYYIHMFMHLAEYSAPSEEFVRRLGKMSSGFAKMMHLSNGKMPTPKKAHTFTIVRRHRNHAAAPRRVPDAAHPVVCPRCRNANRADAKFCAGCGGRLR